MQNKRIVGIDISAKTLDICIIECGHPRYERIENIPSAIGAFLDGFPEADTLIGMENTGRYNNPLYEVLTGSAFEVFVINPLHLKKSMGLTRGKSDRTDAYRICRFIEKHREELYAWQPCPKSVEMLKVLLCERNERVKMKCQLSCARKAYGYVKSTRAVVDLDGMNGKLTECIDDQIKSLERQIETVLRGDEKIYTQYRLMVSIPGVGKVLAWTMIAKTQGFTLICEPRKMACYAGVAPFGHQSGTSLMSRPRVSMYADKALKKILHMGAMSAIRLKNDLATYYNRKVAEGKNKMSVLNAVRNKIIHRIFAVIKRQDFYQPNFVVS